MYSNIRLIVFFLFCSFLSSAQSNFPNGWIGSYSGDMILGFTASENDTVLVDFELEELIADSLWTYKMTYHSDRYGEVVKDYHIVASAKGNKSNYLLDEQNGIVMQQAYINNCFYGIYEVLETLYTVTLRKIEDDLKMELFAAQLKNPKVTKSTENERELEAKSYQPFVVQSVLLKRTK